LNNNDTIAAKLEVNWEGCGKEVGIEIWRVENKRDENGNPDFGINVWPKEHYGEFYQGNKNLVRDNIVYISARAEYD